MTSIDIYSVLSSKPHNPHYLKRYIRFIEGCIQKNIDLPANSYTENHHICPRAKDLFPEYGCQKLNRWNIVTLTGRQHMIAHLILWKVYGGSQTYAFHAMLKKVTKNFKDQRKIKITSRTFENLRKERSILISEKTMGKAIYKDASGNRYKLLINDPSIELLGLVHVSKGVPSPKNNVENYKKPKSSTHTENIKTAIAEERRTNRVCRLTDRKEMAVRDFKTWLKISVSTSFGKNISKALKGLKKSEDHIKNLSISCLNRDSINRVCSLDNRKEYTIGNFTRWVLNK
jgi:hypothetical protein